MSLILKCNNVDYTANYLAGSLNGSEAIHSRMSCAFTLVSKFGTTINEADIQPGETVLITFESVPSVPVAIFAGTVEQLGKRIPEDSVATFFDVECVDFHQIADRLVITEVFENLTADQIILAVRDEHLAPEGVGNGVLEANTQNLTRVVARFETVASFFNRLSEVEGGVYHWRIDFDVSGNPLLHWQSRTSRAASFDITTGMRPIRQVELRKSRQQYRNRQYVRAGLDLTDPQTELFLGDGRNRNFTLRFPVGKKPSVFVNDVAQTIGVQGIDQGRHWYWNKDSNIISQDFSQTPLTNQKTLKVVYEGLLRVNVLRIDSAEQAARAAIEGGTGRYDHVLNEPEIESVEFASRRADGLLQRHAKLADVLTYTTFKDGLRAGQIQSVDLTNFAVMDSFLITNVDFSDVGGRLATETSGPRIEYRITATSSGRFASWHEFFSALFASARRVPVVDDEVTDLLEFFQDGLRFADTLNIDLSDTVAAYGDDDHSVWLVGAEKPLVGSEAYIADPITTIGGFNQSIGAERATVKATAHDVAVPLAFPGAMGWGSDASGGRGGSVIKVTNLNDSGTGSLREALTASGPRTVVFDTGGTITLTSDIWVNNGDLTIAGQTAPGDGIFIRGAAIRLSASNIICRGLRVGAGDLAGGPPFSDRDSLFCTGGAPLDTIIVDHCSIRWGVDENCGLWNTGAYGDAFNIGYSYCIISEALDVNNHSSGMLVGRTGNQDSGIVQFTVHHCLFAHNVDRNPLIFPATEMEFINNVCYNGEHYGGPRCWIEPSVGGCHMFANRVIDGPDYNGTGPEFKFEEGTFYFKNNIGRRRPTNSGDQWLCVTSEAPVVRQDSQLFTPSNIVEDEVEANKNKVLNNAGAVPRDSTDTRVVGEVNAGTGMHVVNMSDIGGFPTYLAGTPDLDTDGDGIPDWYEDANGLDKNNALDGPQIASNGYSNLENYINSLIPIP